jgi:hypothetical protein
MSSTDSPKKINAGIAASTIKAVSIRINVSE